MAVGCSSETLSRSLDSASGYRKVREFVEKDGEDGEKRWSYETVEKEEARGAEALTVARRVGGGGKRWQFDFAT